MERAVRSLQQQWPSLSSQELFVVLSHLHLCEQGALLEEEGALNFLAEEGLYRRLLPQSLIHRFTHQNEPRDPTIAISQFRFQGRAESHVLTWTSVNEHTILINVLRRNSDLEQSDLLPSRSMTYNCCGDFVDFLASETRVPLDRLVGVDVDFS